MTGLINGLVAMARLEEQSELVLTNVNFSDITRDAAEDFKGPVIKDGKEFVMAFSQIFMLRLKKNRCLNLLRFWLIMPINIVTQLARFR